jgi:hypothetical protein
MIQFPASRQVTDKIKRIGAGIKVFTVSGRTYFVNSNSNGLIFNHIKMIVIFVFS